jgi:DNA repair protein SbcC/Rad50
MLLIRLKLDNFRQHQSTQIDFQSGMTAIVGANGTGKTTLLEGITYALYGEQRDIRDTIRFYWSDTAKKKFSSELMFELDAKRYVVTRSNTEGSLIEHTKSGSIVLATGLTDTRRACERLLGLNYDQFINSFCAEQKNLGFLNFRTAAARHEEVARMLGFDRLKMAEDIARERRSVLRTRAETLEKTLGNLSELETARREATAKLKQVQAEIAAMDKQQKALTEKVPPALELHNKAEKWRELQQEIKQIRGQADGLKVAAKLAEKALEVAKIHLVELQGLEPKEEEYKLVEAEVKDWEKKREGDRKRDMQAEQVKTLRCEIVDLDTQLKQLRLVDLAILEKDFLVIGEKLSRSESLAKEKLDDWSRVVGRAQELLAAAQARFEEAKSVLERSKALAAKGVCPECGQPVKEGAVPKFARAKEDFVEKSATLQNAQKEVTKVVSRPAALKKAETEFAELKASLEIARKKRDVAALQHAQATAFQKERTRKAEQAAKLEAQLANSPSVYDAARHQSAQQKLVAMDPEHLRYLVLKSGAAAIEDREKDYKKATTDLEAAKTRFFALEKERNDLAFENEEAVDAAITAHRTLELELRDLQSCYKSSERLKKFAGAAVIQSTARVQEHHDREKELNGAKNGASTYEVLSRELRNLRERLNRTIRPDLEARASENLNLLTNGRYSTLELNDNFEARVIEDGVAKPVISGGEEDVVALSLRLALSELIQERNGRPMTLLILDEVFGSLDAERRQSVLDRLASLKGRFNQILVISHIEEINQVADQALYLSRNTDTRSTVVTDAPPDAAALLL